MTTPTRILNTTSARTVSPLMLARSRAGIGGAVGAFALPTPGGGPGSGTSLAAEAAAPGTPKAESPADRAQDASKSDKSKDKKETDETTADKVKDADAKGEKGETECAGEDGEGGGQGAQAPSQPLTIHTLNGLLLTLPAAASAAVSGRMGMNGQRSASDAPPTPDAKDVQGGRRDGAPKSGGGAAAQSDAPVHGVAADGRGTGGGAGRDAGRDVGGEAVGTERQAPATSGPERSSRARAVQATERSERAAGAGVQADVAAQAPSAARDAKPASTTIGVGVLGGRMPTVGELGAAPTRKSEPQRPSVPTDRTGPAQVVRGVLAAVNQRGGKVTLDLEPGELGRMKVELKLDARTATATFHVGSPEARRLLEDALPQLRQALTDRGVSLERAEVVAPPGELAGAMAAIQAGAQAVAMVVPGAPQELDVRSDNKRANGEERGEDAEGVGNGRRASGEGGTGEGGTARTRVMTIGPDGVDVTV